MTTGASKGILGHVLAELNDFPLPERVTKALAVDGNIRTVEDLTKVGWWANYFPDEDERAADPGWRTRCLSSLIEIEGIGWVRLNHIRRFLAEYGLALTDESEIRVREFRGLPF